jgi:antagonist of KipI
VKAGLGGLGGRALQKEDRLPVGPASGSAKLMKKKMTSSTSFCTTDWTIAPQLLPELSNHYEIRVMRGRQYELFDEDSCYKFWNESFTISPQSDRMGYRIKGPMLRLKLPRGLVSEAVTHGSIQVPMDGNPIILAADRQTTGGYPKIGQLSSVDYTKLAQAKAGDRFSFKEVTLEESQRLLMRQETSLRTLRTVLRDKYR